MATTLKVCHVCGYPVALWSEGGYDAIGIKHSDPKKCIEEIIKNINPNSTARK